MITDSRTTHEHRLVLPSLQGAPYSFGSAIAATQEGKVIFEFSKPGEQSLRGFTLTATTQDGYRALLAELSRYLGTRAPRAGEAVLRPSGGPPDTLRLLLAEPIDPGIP
jgi:hypothetical protein